MTNRLYKPLGVAIGVLGGLLAGAIFRRVWQLVSHEAEPPAATREDRSWGEVLTAAAMEGAIYALVRAALGRGIAAGFKKATGTWPGEPEAQ